MTDILRLSLHQIPQPPLSQSSLRDYCRNKTALHLGPRRRGIPPSQVLSSVLRKRPAAGRLHEQNPDAYTLAADKGYIAYQDLTDNARADNGEIYVGIVAPWAKEARYQPFAAPEAARRGASGHILALGTIAPDAAVTYWWGSAWSKAGWQSPDEWNSYLNDFAVKVANPLKVTY